MCVCHVSYVNKFKNKKLNFNKKEKKYFRNIATKTKRPRQTNDKSKSTMHGRRLSFRHTQHSIQLEMEMKANAVAVGEPETDGI